MCGAGDRILTAENTLTNYGEIALKIECEVRIRFCPADSPLED